MTTVIKKTLETGLGVVLILMFTIHLGTSAIWDSNEAFYTETPRVMVERGDYVVPSFNGQPRLNKPPLSYWMVAAAYRLFGASVLVQRLVGMGLLLAVFAVVWFWGHDLFASRKAAWAAVFITALTPRILIMGRRALIEIALMLFITAALWCFYRFRHTGSGRHLFWFYTALAAGFMTKGPVAVVLPGLVIAVFLIWQGEWRRIPEMKPLRGALWFLLLTVPWFVALGFRMGAAAPLDFFTRENIARFAGGSFGPDRGLVFYPGVFIIDFFPWSLLLLAAAAIWWAHRRELATETKAHLTFLLLWLLLPLLFFSLSAGKQEYYLMPVYPAAALLLAGTWSLLRRRLVMPRLLRVVLFVLALLLPLAGVLTVLVSRRWWAPSLWADSLFLGALLLISVWTGTRLWRGKSFDVLLAPFAHCLVIVMYVVLVVLPGIEAFRPVPRLAERLEQVAPPGALVGTFDLAAPSLCYYTGRSILELKSTNELVECFSRSQPLFCLMPAKDLPILDERRLAYETVAREPLFPLKLMDMLTFDADNPRHTLVLVRNLPAISETD
jgi:4-amino-4-deoxy-L-arabinose transferase-like glycosyltransferase